MKNRRPFDEGEMIPDVEYQINMMSQCVQECIQPLRTYKLLLLVGKRLERGLFALGHVEEDFPFTFPLKTKDNVLKCENFAGTQD